MKTGMWIWRLRHCEGGKTEAIRQRAREYGIDHLVIKITDGVKHFNGDLLKPVFDALRPSLALWVWTYTYGKDPEREAEVFGTRAVALGVTGVVVDAEGNSYTNSAQRATRFMTTLRAIVGTMHVGVSSHRYPTNHKTFPFEAFMLHADSWWPQAYYLQQGPGVIKSLQRVLDEGHRFGKPMIVTGATYTTEEGDAVGKPENVATFLRMCEAQGIRMANFWSWEHTPPAIWEIIRTYTHSLEVT